MTSETCLFRGDNLKAVLVERARRDKLIVAFAHSDEQPGVDNQGFGRSYFDRTDLSVLYVTCSGNDWYQYAEVSDLAAAIRWPVAGFAERITYGASMGAYAALYLSGLVDASKIIAFSPQRSIDPRRVPFETRWDAEASRIGFRDGLESRSDGVAYLFYDPGTMDGRHAALIRQDFRTVETPLRVSGHSTLLAFVDQRLWKPAFSQIVEGAYVPDPFVAQYRENRAASSLYFFYLAARARHPPRRIKFLKHALAIDGGVNAGFAVRAKLELAPLLLDAKRLDECDGIIASLVDAPLSPSQRAAAGAIATRPAEALSQSARFGDVTRLLDASISAFGLTEVSWVHCLLADARVKLGQPAAAHQAARRAVAVAPASYHARKVLAATFRAQGQIDRYAEEMAAAARLNGEKDRGWSSFEVARTMMEARRPSTAMVHIEAALRADPNPDFLVLRNLIVKLQGAVAT